MRTACEYVQCDVTHYTLHFCPLIGRAVPRQTEKGGVPLTADVGHRFRKQYINSMKQNSTLG